MHKDYLGTILAITDEKGKLVEERHFDAWGNLTHGSMQVLDRGYTSHEHLQEVGLIHMNGRLYDPMLRRFLNADENIQDPTNTQCYNKYGYVMNNPLMFNDPDGEYAVGLAIAIGALVAVLSYTATIYARDGSLRHWKLGDAYVSAIYGAFSGAVTFGVGSIFSAAGGTATALATSIKDVAGGVGLAVVQAGAHAVTQGVLSSVQGGNFWSAALSGAFGSLGASAFGAIGDFAKSTVGTISFGAISGGIGAKLSGGNFWQGVVIGGIVAGLNHTLHNALDESPEGEGPKPKKVPIKKIPKELLLKISRLREAFSFLEDYGGYAEIAGLVLAPFTEGTSLCLSGVGFAFTAVGTTGNLVLDYYEYRLTNDPSKLTFMRNRIIKYGLTLGTGKAFEKLTVNFADKLITKFLDVTLDKGIYPEFLPVEKKKI